jgi:hypothetical protein
MSSSGPSEENSLADLINPYMRELKMHPKELMRRSIGCFGFVRGGRLGAVKIHRRCQGGTHSHEKEKGTKSWRWGHLVASESRADGGGQNELRRAILRQPGGVEEGNQRGNGEEDEGIK